jgi:threonine/homoserine/homoserine lactone efflux protein
MLALFLKSLLIGYSGAVMPGPMFTYTVEKSMRHGSKTGLLISAGHSLLELILVVLIFMGAGKYLTTDTARSVISILGGVVLGYLGIGMIRDVYLNKIAVGAESGKPGKQGNMLLSGAVLSAVNPYFIIWWMVVGLALISSAYDSFGIAGVAVFYLGHILSDISWFTFVSILVSKTRHLINLKIYKAVIITLAICLIGFCISFLANGMQYIL